MKPFFSIILSLTLSISCQGYAASKLPEPPWSQIEAKNASYQTESYGNMVAALGKGDAEAITLSAITANEKRMQQFYLRAKGKEVSKEEAIVEAWVMYWMVAKIGLNSEFDLAVKNYAILTPETLSEYKFSAKIEPEFVKKFKEYQTLAATMAYRQMIDAYDPDLKEPSMDEIKLSLKKDETPAELRARFFDEYNKLMKKYNLNDDIRFFTKFSEPSFISGLRKNHAGDAKKIKELFVLAGFKETDFYKTLRKHMKPKELEREAYIFAEEKKK